MNAGIDPFLILFAFSYESRCRYALISEVNSDSLSLHLTTQTIDSRDVSCGVQLKIFENMLTCIVSYFTFLAKVELLFDNLLHKKNIRALIHTYSAHLKF
jgi:hypothetical protein